MTKIFLHIGQSKTGSTSIQGCLYKNRNMMLSKHRALYPETLSAKNSRIHTDLVLLSKDNDGIDNLLPANQSILRRNLLRKGVVDRDTFDRFATRKRKLFISEVAQKSPETIIISSELLWGHVTTVEELTRVRNLLHDVADEVTIVVYLRRQDERMVSDYSQATKMGNPGNNVLEIAASRIYPYLEKLESWSSVFGLDRVVVRVFERNQLVGQDVVADFLSIVGIPDRKMARHERGNERLDVHKIEILKGAFPGKFLRRDFSKEEFRQWRKLVLKLEKMEPLGPPIQFPNDVRQCILDNHADANKEIARKYLGRDDGQLFSLPGSDDCNTNNKSASMTDATLKVVRALLSDTK